MTDLKHKIIDAVTSDLKSVENALANHLQPHYDLVKQVAGHILFAGGKRLRPLLMILSARACGYQDNQAPKFSIIFEYLHAASLLHDDVVDGGELRRGSPAAHHVWDPPTAVLTGDFLLARALSLAADTELAEVIRTIASITEYLSQGEIEQLNRRGDLSLNEAEYLEIIRCKTAVLFQGACRTGALISTAPKSHVQALGDYGHHLGMAFQMADDLLDYTMDSQVLGKKAGADLREGKLTLPVIYTLGQTQKNERQWIEQLVRTQDIETAQFDRLVELLHDNGGIAYTRKCAIEHVEKAKAALSFLPAGAEHSILTDIADYALIRSN